MKEQPAMQWTSQPRVARHWRAHHEPSRIECRLCPRHCKPHPGQTGYCRVRKNVDGQFHTLNYGVSVQATEETIETEAVNHYQPGARILSLGNVGCMMSCTFCHNWETSQVKHLDARAVQHYTPEQVVDLARAHGIRMLSWTYNDPVVWHEFVVDMARLAARHGIQNLYKSAFYIEEEPVRELIDVIDVFSLSLKSMSAEFYRKVTGGELQPVLDRICQVHASGRHLEISNLLVTDLNDTADDARKTVRWVLDHLGPTVPLHFVRFHPAYKYTSVGRTPVAALFQARDIARAEGIHYCYLGNLYQPGVSDTACRSCGSTLVRRFGLTVSIVGLSAAGDCARCGAPGPIRDPFGGAAPPPQTASATDAASEFRFTWNEEVNSVHIITADDKRPLTFDVVRVPSGARRQLYAGNGLGRVIVSRASAEETGFVVQWRRGEEVHFLPVLDRAHFPVFGSTDPTVAELKGAS
jgi:pyruvate formate lyase activating enzyme